MTTTNSAVDSALVPTSKEGEVLLADQEPTKHPIALVLEQFLNTVDDYRDTLLIALPAIGKDRDEKIKAIHKKITKFVAKTNEDGTKTLEAQSAHDAKEMLDALDSENRLIKARPMDLILRSFFIGLFAEYDNFIGELLKTIYATNPSLYKGIKREISFNDLLEFSNLNDVKRDMLEKQIDAFRRDSYIEQFATLERMFEIKTLRAFDEWSKFVEITQRRNLVTHNGGRVSQQYLDVCCREKVVFESKPSLSSDLRLDGKYIGEALLVISKVSFMLVHTLWRKISPADIDVANQEMNNSIFDLLSQKRWRVAAAFGDFALTEPMKRNIKDMDLRIRIINHAIALKNQKNLAAAVLLMDSMDWSASLREFVLAKAVLAERYGEAAKLMRNIGKQGELVTELAYHSWPLFDEFRGTVEFQKAYEAIYGIPFITKVSEAAQRKDSEKEQLAAATAVAQKTSRSRKKATVTPTSL